MAQPATATIWRRGVSFSLRFHATMGGLKSMRRKKLAIMVAAHAAMVACFDVESSCMSWWNLFRVHAPASMGGIVITLGGAQLIDLYVQPQKKKIIHVSVVFVAAVFAHPDETILGHSAAKEIGSRYVRRRNPATDTVTRWCGGLHVMINGSSH